MFLVGDSGLASRLRYKPYHIALPHKIGAKVGNYGDKSKAKFTIFTSCTQNTFRYNNLNTSTIFIDDYVSKT